MKKLVILKLNGNLQEKGFEVSLEIGRDGDRADLELAGHLPENPELAEAIAQHWQEKYRPLGLSYRIKPGKITYDGSIHKAKIVECKNSAEALRDRINQWLRSPSFQDLNLQMREELDRTDEIRLLLRTDDPLLHKLPWHEWDFFGRYSNAEIAFCSPQFVKLHNASRKSSRRKVKILVILGHRTGIDIESDRALFNSLDKRNADVTFLDEPTGRSINDRLWEAGWDIIFFAGHSETEENIGRIYINPEDSLTFERDSQLWYGLRKAAERGLQLAIFNSCDGLGLAKQLDDLNIPQMIVMRDFVADVVAQEFLKQFLTSYISGQPLYLAAREAREYLQGMEEELPCASWLPVIWQNQAVIPPSWKDLIPRWKSWESRPHPISWQRSLAILLAASLAVTSTTFWGRWQGKLQPLELKAYDHLMQQRPIAGPDDRLLIIRVTPEDTKRLNQPPEETGNGAKTLSDRSYEKLFAKLKPLQPSVIAFLRAYQGAVSPEYPNFKASLAAENLIAMCQSAIPDRNDSAEDTLAPADVSADRVGFYTFMEDPDGAIRRHLLRRQERDPHRCKSKNTQEFGFKVAQLYLRNQEQASDRFINRGRGLITFKPLQPHQGGYHKLQSLKPNQDQVQVLLNYRAYENYKRDIAPTFSLTDLLEDRLTLEDVKGRIVLLCSDFPNRDRSYPTPQGMLPSYYIVAQQILDSLDTISGERKPIEMWPWWGDLLWIWMWSIIGGLIAFSLNFNASKYRYEIAIFGMVSAIALLYGLCFLFLLQSLWIPLIPAALTLLLTSTTIAVYQHLKKLKYDS